MGTYRNTRTITTNTNLTSTNENIKVDVSGGPVQVMLPIATGDTRVNDVIKISHTDGNITSNNITIIAHTGGTATILGGSITINTVGGVAFVEFSDNDRWINVSESTFWEETGTSNTALKDIKGGHTISGVSDNSLIGGGNGNNLNTSTNSIIIGGSNNVLSGGSDTSIIGGVNNIIDTSNNSGILTSQNSSINISDNSTINGGENNIVNHDNSHIIGSNLTTDKVNTTFVENLTVRGDYIVHSDTIPSTSLDSTDFKGSIIYFEHTGITGSFLVNNDVSGSSKCSVGQVSTNKSIDLTYYNDDYIRAAVTPTNGINFYRNKGLLGLSQNSDGMIIKLDGSGNDSRLWFEQNGNSPMLIAGGGTPSDLRLGIALNPDGTEIPTAQLQVGGTGTTGTFKYRDGNQQSGYVLTSDNLGNATWQPNSSFTGNTSGDCITDLYVRRLYGCSPITVHDTITYNGSIIDSATTNSFIFGSNHVLTATSLTHGVDADANSILGGFNNRITPFQVGRYNTIIGGYGNEINARINYASIIGATNSNISNSTLSPNTIIGGNSNTITTSKSSVIIGGEGNFIGNSDRTIILGGSGITGTTDDTVYTPDLNVSGNLLVENTSGKFFTDIENSVGPLVLISGGSSDLPIFGVSTPSSDAITMGVRGSSEVSYPGYGNQGDSFIYSSNSNNGINIISSQGTGTDDYIRFYAGQDANGTTPDIHIQGSGTTRGNIGINNESPTSKLDIVGTNGYQQLRLRTSYTPTSTADSNGEIGDIAWDNSYLYIKTGTGWGRVQLDFAF